MAIGKPHRAKFSEHLRSVVSEDVLNPSDGSYELIQLPKFALVFMVAVEIVSVFGSTSTIDIGLKGNGVAADPDAFLKTGDITQTAVGWYKNGTGPHGKGAYLNGAGSIITVDVVKGNAAATAKLRVIAQYDVIA